MATNRVADMMDGDRPLSVLPSSSSSSVESPAPHNFQAMHVSGEIVIFCQACGVKAGDAGASKRCPNFHPATVSPALPPSTIKSSPPLPPHPNPPAAYTLLPTLEIENTTNQTAIEKQQLGSIAPSTAPLESIVPSLSSAPVRSPLDSDTDKEESSQQPGQGCVYYRLCGESACRGSVTACGMCGEAHCTHHTRQVIKPLSQKEKEKEEKQMKHAHRRHNPHHSHVQPAQHMMDVCPRCWACQQQPPPRRSIFCCVISWILFPMLWPCVRELSPHRDRSTCPEQRRCFDYWGGRQLVESYVYATLLLRQAWPDLKFYIMCNELWEVTHVQVEEAIEKNTYSFEAD